MTLPVQLNILLTAYSIFSSGSYLHLLLIFFIGLSFWFCFTQVIYTVWTWIHYCLTVSWFIVSGFPVQLCIILWELQDFNYDTVEFTNISCFMIFCSWCFVSEIPPYSKATNIYLCLLLEYLMLCFFLFVLNPSERVFAYTSRQEFNFILFPCKQQLVQDDNWIVFPSPLIISSSLSYLCGYSS